MFYHIIVKRLTRDAGLYFIGNILLTKSLCTPENIEKALRMARDYARNKRSEISCIRTKNVGKCCGMILSALLKTVW